MERLGSSVFTCRPFRFFAIGVGVCAWVLLAEAAAFACSDKFVVLGTGVRFERVYKSEHPTKVLLFMNPASQLPEVDKKTHLRAALRFAGHKPTSVDTSAELERAMQKSEYGAVLVSYGDAEAVEQIVKRAGARSILLPVLYQPSDEELRSATEKYGCPVTGSRKTSTMIDTLDRALEASDKGTSCAAPR
ncbi:MAG: hypothetical protein NDJ75_01340 [Thermoanaerobaculia bacterium]|nr:hypothetical protein [Thermoanaerobaculia bacterium]